MELFVLKMDFIIYLLINAFDKGTVLTYCF